MSNLTKEQAYVKMIEVLFAGTIHAEEYEINDEVIRIVDTVFLEITRCHNRIKPLAVLFTGLANVLDDAVPSEVKLLIGSENWQDYLLGKVEDMGKNTLIEKVEEILNPNGLVDKAVGIVEVANGFVQAWIEYTQKDRRLLLCINKARANWRSPLQIALMGL